MYYRIQNVFGINMIQWYLELETIYLTFILTTHDGVKIWFVDCIVNGFELAYQQFFLQDVTKWNSNERCYCRFF